MGVSERLVAYALNGTGRVAGATRLRIIDEAQRLGYRPNRAAKALATGRSGLLALCLPQLATAYGDAITRIVEARVRASAFDLVVARMAGASAPAGAPLIPAGLAQVDGAFLLEPPRSPSPSELAVIRNAVVLGVFDSQRIGSLDHVRIDLEKAARLAAGIHIRRLPRQFVFVTASDIPRAESEARYAAYLSAASEIGQEPAVIVLERDHDLMSDACDAMLGHAGRAGCPDAIMCSNDEIAIGVLRALRRLGRPAPDCATVTGCDGIAFAEDVYPPLTTIVQPFRQMLDLAWSFLMQRLDNPGRPVQQGVIDATLVERESTSRLPFERRSRND